MGVLIILGGIGWAVIVDIYRRKRFSRFSLDTKMIITTSIFLWIAGALVFFLAEYSNDDTIGLLSIREKGGFASCQKTSQLAKPSGSRPSCRCPPAGKTFDSCQKISSMPTA